MKGVRESNEDAEATQSPEVVDVCGLRMRTRVEDITLEQVLDILGSEE